MKKTIISTIIATCLGMGATVAHAQVIYGNASGNVVNKANHVGVPSNNADVELSLDQILSKNVKQSANNRQLSAEKNLRLSKIRQIAFEYGANVGRAEQAKFYEKQAELHGAKWDKDYDFTRLLISQNPPVLPAVISHAQNNYRLVDEKTMTVNANMWKIEVPVQIVSVVPTWRDYLKMSFTVDKHPSKGFLPKDKIESQVWDEAVKEGYAHGKRTADMDWQNAKGELNRDFAGMLNYKILLANGLLEGPIMNFEEWNTVTNEDGTVMQDKTMMIRILKDATFNKKKAERNLKNNPNPAVYKLPNGQNM